MYKQIKTALFLFSAILIFLSAYILLGIYEQKSLSKVTVDFELPLLDSIAEKYNIPKNPEIEKVIIAGFFSDWDPVNKNYIMEEVSDSNGKAKWIYELTLPPGEHQYKFVVYIKNRIDPIWTQDNDSYKNIFNGLGSYNSLLSVKSYEKMRSFILSVIYILLILTSVLLLHIILSKSDIKSSLPVMVIFVVICNILLAGYYLNNNKSNHILISKSIISILDSEFINYFSENLPSMYEGNTIYNIYNHFLWYKLDKMGIKNLSDRFKYASLVFFDRNYEMISYDYRYFSGYENKDRISNEVIRTTLLGYFDRHIKRVKEKNIDAINYKIPSYQQLFTDIHFSKISKNFKTGHDDFSFTADTFFYPCVLDNEIYGYYGILFSGKPINVVSSFIIGNFIFIFLTAAYCSYLILSGKKEKLTVLKNLTVCLTVLILQQGRKILLFVF